MEETIERKIKEVSSKSFKRFLTSLKNKDFEKTRKIIKNEKSKSIKTDYLLLMNKVIKTDVKFVKENRGVVYEDMILNGVDVKIIFRRVDMNELTEFLSYKNLDLIVNQTNTFYESINGKEHVIFPFAECRSFLWLNCVVAMDVKETNLINIIKNGVKKSRPGFWPRYNLDFSNGYMGYKLFLAIQDFNNFLWERQNILYCSDLSSEIIRYKFKIDEPIEIIIKNKVTKERFTFKKFIYPSYLGVPTEEKLNEWKIVVRNSITNSMDIRYNVGATSKDGLTLILKFGNFEKESDEFKFYLFANSGVLSKRDIFLLGDKKNFYTGLYNGRYFQTWYEFPYKIPPVSYEKYIFLSLVDPLFVDYILKEEGQNKYNISEKKRKKIFDWIANREIDVPLIHGSNLIDFTNYHHYGDNLMPPVKGFPSNRIVKNYDEMEED